MSTDALSAGSAWEAEASVLGCLLLEPEELAGQIFELLPPESFGTSELRTLYKAAREIWLQKQPVDPVVLLSKAGEAYAETVRSAMALTPTAAHWETYCQLVEDAAQLREARSMAMEILDCRTGDEARAALQRAQGLLMPKGRKTVWSWEEMVMGFMDRLDGPAPDYLDWGIPALNEQIQIRAGKFVILGAESSVGKTAFALQLGFGLAAKGKKVGFFSLETPQGDAADRMMAQQARIRLSDIKKRMLKMEQVADAVDVAQQTMGYPFDLIEAAGFGCDEIRSTTLARGYDVIFVDYVQLVDSSRDDPIEQVRATSMALHTLSQQLGITVVGLSQITPPPKNKSGERPELSKENLRESRQLIHDADVILIMDLSELDNYSSTRILKVDKNKDGPRCRMLLTFDAPRLRFDYSPGIQDPDAQASAARNAKMDENRKRRQEKARRKYEEETPIDGQTDLDDLP